MRGALLDEGRQIDDGGPIWGPGVPSPSRGIQQRDGVGERRVGAVLMRA